jgi:hypothetical protein
MSLGRGFDGWKREEEREEGNGKEGVWEEVMHNELVARSENELWL